jgi:hypothetical protein
MRGIQGPARFLPIIPVYFATHRKSREVHDQELNGVHGLSKLPVGEFPLAGHHLEVACDFISGQLPERAWLQVLEKALDPRDVPTPSFFGDAPAAQQIDAVSQREGAPSSRRRPVVVESFGCCIIRKFSR